VWHGFDRQTERGEKSLHPSQKPVALFEWCLDKLKLKAGDTVLDPYMGTGACGVACLKRGINYIGIELVEKYYQIARGRVESASITQGCCKSFSLVSQKP
jgi:site-specific DNA-methyltransferase (adenine-specific)